MIPKLKAEDFRIVPDGARPAPVPPGHPRCTSDVNRTQASVWQCDFCGALAPSPKPVVPQHWALVLSRVDPWWGEIHLVCCAVCKGAHEAEA